MSDELLKKVTKAIQTTGFPLELEAAAIARRLGWVTFHSVEYSDPVTEKLRELDLMFYKIINGRRIEIRISCKSSTNKQFVFFTHIDRTRRNLGELKITPVCDSIDEFRSIPDALKNLRFYSDPHKAVNYTVLAGNKVDREAKALLRDAIMSVVTSLHHSILPNGLLVDPRGTVHLFLVVLRGRMFDAQYDEETNDMLVSECDYARWDGLIDIPKQYYDTQILDVRGLPVSFADAYYWFGTRISVECIKDTQLEWYLQQTEDAFSGLDPDAYASFGKAWTAENFPKAVRLRPKIAIESESIESEETYFDEGEAT